MRPAAVAILPSFLALSSALPGRLLNLLVGADARYREARKLEELPEERLRDMGLTRPARVAQTSFREDWG